MPKAMAPAPEATTVTVDRQMLFGLVTQLTAACDLF